MTPIYRVPMVFPGQASQAVGMARDLAQSAGPASEFLATVDSVLKFGLTDIMFEGPLDVLTATKNAQPAILAHSVAVMLALRELGVEPEVVAGHSLGEFSAAVAAGAISPADGLRLVRQRGELMFAAGPAVPGVMAAVLGLPGEQVRTVCEAVTCAAEVVVMANHNSAAQVAISGTVTGVARATEALQEAGARRIIPLKVSGAFHSPLLAEAGRAFAESLAEVAITAPKVPLLANVSATPVHEASVLKQGFAQQLTAPVLWHDTMEKIVGGEVPPTVVS